MLDQPLRLKPVLKQYLWGGRRLGTVLGKPIGDGDHFAESWEVVDHGADQSVVAEGPLAGKTLHELVTQRGEALFGRHHPQSQFPLLFKFLDAQQTLSVQVHPNDEQGARLDAARPRQDRGLGRARRRAGKQDLRRAAAGRRSRDARARVSRAARATPVCTNSSRAGRLRVSRSRHGSRARRGPDDRRDSAVEQHDVSPVRLEPRRSRRQSAAAAHPGVARHDRLRPRAGRARSGRNRPIGRTSSGSSSATSSCSIAGESMHRNHAAATSGFTSWRSSRARSR